MGTGVDDLILSLCVRVLQSEFGDIHAGKTEGVSQLQHLGPQVAQVLGDDPGIGQLLKDLIENGIAGSLDPVALNSGGAGGGDLPISIKGTEVVNADDVIQPAAVADAVYPELKAVFLQRLPVVDGIAPALAGGTEVVGGHAGDEVGIAPLVQQEVLSPLPHIQRVDAHIEGDVAHHKDALAVGIGLQCAPLLAERVLEEHLETDLLLKGADVKLFFDDPVPLLLRPLVPAAHAVVLFQGDKDGIGIDPALGAEGVKLRLLLLLAVKFSKGSLEIGQLIGSGLVIVQSAGRGQARPVSRQVALLLQQLQIHIQLIACVGGVGLIGAVAVAQGVHRQDLPDLESGICQNIHELIGGLAQAAHAVV